MATITQKDLLKKYGISLSKGKYDIEVADGKYKIYTVQDDTDGCLLLGLNKTKGAVLDSQTTMAYFMARVPNEFDLTIE